MIVRLPVAWSSPDGRPCSGDECEAACAMVDLWSAHPPSGMQSLLGKVSSMFPAMQARQRLAT